MNPKVSAVVMPLLRVTESLRRRVSTLGLPPWVALLQQASGFQVSQAIYVVAKLGIADLLKDGPRSAEQLAAATGADPRSLYRVMRALAGVEIFAENRDGRFRLTRLGLPLRSDVPDSVRATAIMFGEDWHWRAWGSLMYSVKTGEPAFAHVFGSEPYVYFGSDPEAGAVFERSMTALTTQAKVALLATYDLTAARTIVDVGGGYGTLLGSLLKANPSVRGVLYEIPPVAEGARPIVEASGLSQRCEVIAGDVFETVPNGGDIYILSSVLHNWDDERSVAILKNCARAMGRRGRLLVVEFVLPSGNELHNGKLVDLEMLVMHRGGHERTRDEYRALFARAGLKIRKVLTDMSQMSVIEGVPAR